MSGLSVALLGTGIFARDVYSAVLLANQSLCNVAAVWSRSQSAAVEYVATYAPNAKALHGDDTLQQILDDPSIHVVIVVLPVQAALKVVQRALAAGKHVIEEKPVAGTVQEAVAAIQQYRAAQRSLWCFAENYRYEEVFHAAAQLSPSMGDIIKLDLVADLPMDMRNKYYTSDWRRDTAGCPGGMIMESSVHFISALRLIAQSCGLGEAVSVSAHTTHVKKDLSDPDSIVGVVRFNGGCPASVSISLAANHVKWSLTVVGTEGSLEVSRGGWTGSRGEYQLTYKRTSDEQPQVQRFPFTGMQNEFKAFLTLISTYDQQGAAALANSAEALTASPEEGARDLALVESLIASGAAGGAPVSVVQVPASVDR